MDEEGIMNLSQLCNGIVQTQTFDKEFPRLLEEYSNFLLSSSSSSPNQINPDENFQALIMVISKLAITSYDILPEYVFHQVFRSIVAFDIHYFIISKEGYTKFINEWPIPFAKNYIFSIFNNFLPKFEKEKIVVEFSIATFLIYIYYSDDPSNNPFLKVLDKLLNVDFYAPIFDMVQMSISTSSFSVLLFYTLITQCSNFKSYCLSCVDTTWVFSLIDPIVTNTNSNSNEIAEIRLNILLIFTEDLEFSNSITKRQNGAALKIINDLIAVIKHFINLPNPKPIIILTSLSIITNICQRINGFDAQTSDSVFSMLNFLYKNKDHNNQYIDFMSHFVFLIEAISVYRMRSNIELIYAVVRQYEILEKIKSIPNLRENFKRALDNLLKLRNFLYETVIKKNPKVLDYNSMLLLLTTFIESWNIDGFFQVSPFPFFKYVKNELSSSLKFFRVTTLKEIQHIL